MSQSNCYQNLKPLLMMLMEDIAAAERIEVKDRISQAYWEGYRSALRSLYNRYNREGGAQ